MSELTKDEIIELAKKEINYSSQLAGKLSADVFFWILGYEYCKEQGEDELEADISEVRKFKKRENRIMKFFDVSKKAFDEIASTGKYKEY